MLQLIFACCEKILNLVYDTTTLLPSQQKNAGFNSVFAFLYRHFFVQNVKKQKSPPDGGLFCIEGWESI